MDASPDLDLSFTKSDLGDVVSHDNDPVVISVVMVGRRVHRVLIDQGNLTNVMFWSMFANLWISPDQLRPHDGCLVGFARDQVEVRGYVDLRTTFSDDKAARTVVIRYVVVNTPSAYNLLLGRPSLNRLGAVASTKHMKMKLPSLERIVIVIKSDQKAVRKCYERNLKNKRRTYSTTVVHGGGSVEVLENGIASGRRPGPASDV